MHFSAQSTVPLSPSLFPGGTPLGAARHARAEHAGGESRAHVDTRGQLGPGALPAAAAAGDGVAVAVVVAGQRPRLLELGRGCRGVRSAAALPAAASSTTSAPSATSSTSTVVAAGLASTASPAASTGAPAGTSTAGASPAASTGTSTAGPASPAGASVPAASLHRPVARRAVRAGARVAAVLGLPRVAVTRGVGLPRAVLGTLGPARHVSHRRTCPAPHLMAAPTGHANSHTAPGRSREQ